MSLAEGQHNQFGDLPWTARAEMLIEQWILARPEVQGFLSTQQSEGTPERWMAVVDAIKKLERWAETPVRHFHDMAVFGEELLLSIRVGDWSNDAEPEQAANWARYWCQAVQQYTKAEGYRLNPVGDRRRHDHEADGAAGGFEWDRAA